MERNIQVGGKRNETSTHRKDCESSLQGFASLQVLSVKHRMLLPECGECGTDDTFPETIRAGRTMKTKVAE